MSQFAEQIALVLTHGAGSNCNAPLLVALDRELTASGIAVIRYNLPYRQHRPTGPPRPSDAEKDRAGLEQAVAAAKNNYPRVWLGGHSYGGRQGSMLAAEKPNLVEGLLLMSYPLHPPGKPNQMRTAHLSNLRVPVVFVHGATDAFGSTPEMLDAKRLIPSRTEMLEIEGAGHDLGRDKNAVARRIATAFTAFLASIYPVCLAT